MPRIEFEHRQDGVARVSAAEVRAGGTLLAAAQRAGLPVARGCGAHALCGRCNLRVLEGASGLEPEGEAERRAKQRNRVDPAERLACACRVRGPARLTASYW